jgi:dihydroxyacetone kinase
MTKGTMVTPEIWAHALASALTKLYTYTRARPPSRTLIDPLAAFIGTLEDASSDLSAAVKAAAEATEATKAIAAKAGRSAYIDTDMLKEQKVADPGAWGIKVILESLVI